MNIGCVVEGDARFLTTRLVLRNPDPSQLLYACTRLSALRQSYIEKSEFVMPVELSPAFALSEEEKLQLNGAFRRNVLYLQKVLGVTLQV